MTVGDELRRKVFAVAECILQGLQADFRAPVVIHQDVAHDHHKGTAKGNLHLVFRNAEKSKRPNFIAHTKVIGQH